MQDKVDRQGILHPKYCIAVDVRITTYEQFTDYLLVAACLYDQVNVGSSHVVPFCRIQNQAGGAILRNRIGHRFYSPKPITSIVRGAQPASTIKLHLRRVGILIHAIDRNLADIQYCPLDWSSVD